MRFLPLTLPTITENLALDEALLLEAEAGRGGEVLRIWEWRHHAVVLGSGGKLAEDVDEAACRADEIPIMRRSSGGGTVLLGRGCLLFSLVLRYDSSPALREIASSYSFILGRIADALADCVPGIEHVGTSDLASRGCQLPEQGCSRSTFPPGAHAPGSPLKFSGNSQQRKRNHLLHHGTLLYGFDLGCVARYLRMPVKQPDYRAQRTHRDFLMNLPADATGLTDRLRRAWGAEEELPDWPREEVAKLAAEKYGKAEWVARR